MALLTYYQLPDTEQERADAMFLFSMPGVQYLYELGTSGQVLCRHLRTANRSGRQMCCEVCHQCGTQMNRVLDGELWCAECEAYR